jgi:hypothetical protein
MGVTVDGEVVDAGAPRGGGELVGRLVWKHVGLCSVNGPQGLEIFG